MLDHKAIGYAGEVESRDVAIIHMSLLITGEDSTVNFIRQRCLRTMRHLKMEQVIQTVEYLKERWQEPSSHAAMSAICQTLGLQLNEGTVQTLFQVLSVGFGVAGIWIGERKDRLNG